MKPFDNIGDVKKSREYWPERATTTNPVPGCLVLPQQNATFCQKHTPLCSEMGAPVSGSLTIIIYNELIIFNFHNGAPRLYLLGGKASFWRLVNSPTFVGGGFL